MFSVYTGMRLLLGILPMITLIQASTQRPMTTTPRTTIQTTVPGSCEHNGRLFADGEEIERDQNNCYWATCEGGSVSYYDDRCFLVPPTCDGEEEQIPGVCCKLCHTTPTPPTTTPYTTTTPIQTTIPTPPGSCMHNGKRYMDGETIYKDKCSEMICLDGQKVIGDDKCMFITPECNGVLKYVPTQCCPLCLNVSTPMTPTTTPPATSTSTTTTRITPSVTDTDNKTISDNGSTTQHGTYLFVVCMPLLSTVWFRL